MGLEELLRVLREEAAHEEQLLRDGAARDVARILGEARSQAAHLREAALAREERGRASRLRAAREAAERERERALLGEARRHLDALRAEAQARAAAEATAADLERWIAELVGEAGPVDAVLVVDPGAGPIARSALAALGVSPVPEVREAGVPRGGVELVTGSLVLDDTVPSRLERAWPRAEPEIAGILLGEG